MKNRIITLSLREIKSSYKRFLSLMLMSFLGVAVFIGMRSANKVLLSSLDKYYDVNDVYDIKIVSTLGLTDEDVDSLKKLDSTDKVVGIHSKDVYFNNGDKTEVIRIIEYSEDINRFVLEEGRLPKEKDEIVVEYTFLDRNNLKLNDYISIKDEDNNIKVDKLKIVGTVTSPLYILNSSPSTDRGSTTLGNGSVKYYTFGLKELFDMDCYSEIYLTVKDTKDEITSEDKYNKLIEKSIDEIKSIKGDREKSRYEFIYSDALKEINDKETEGKEELNKAKKDLDKFKNELNKGYNKLVNSRKEINNGKKELNSALTKINKGKQDIKNGEAQLKKSKQDLTKAENEINNKLKPYGFKMEEVYSYKALLEAYPVSVLKMMIPTDYPNYDKIILLLDDYDANKEQYNTLFNSIEKIINGKKTITSKEKELNKAKSEINKAYNSYLSGKKKLDNAEKELNKGFNTYNKNLKLYNDSLKKYNDNKKEFEDKIKDAKDKLKDIEVAKWYVNERLDNPDYSGFMNIGGSIDNLAKAFPTIFFIVAIFMSLMSMSRMALEDREEIGSLKAMGFSNKHIIMKYVIYSLLATIIGGILGCLFGFYFLTWFVWNVYGILYRILEFRYYYSIINIILGILIAVICITGTSIITVNNILTEKPSELLRPKAPSVGKKTIFEHLPFWDKIKFSNKVTIRNICRYKKRVIMTIIGIVGCTTLMITGYGIKDSITGIADKHFYEVLVYDDLVYIDDSTKDLDRLFGSEDIKYKLNTRISQITVGNTQVNLHAVEDSSKLNDILKAKSTVTGNMTSLVKGKVIVSDKLARIHKIKVGKKIKFEDVNNKIYEFEVSDIFENYVSSYIFIDKETYEEVIGSYKTNAIYLKLNDIDNEETFLNELLKNDEILSVMSINSTMSSVNNMLVSLDKIVLILIILSGALSFVVLYNLSYINISERRREIATLKVLGFYNLEVDNYIIKENFIITVIGILIGLVLSKPFVSFIVDSIEIDLVKFIHNIRIESYLLSFMFLTLFTLIVSFIIHFTLKKIDMIESLKSVE